MTKNKIVEVGSMDDLPEEFRNIVQRLLNGEEDQMTSQYKGAANAFDQFLKLYQQQYGKPFPNGHAFVMPFAKADVSGRPFKAYFFFEPVAAISEEEPETFTLRPEQFSQREIVDVNKLKAAYQKKQKEKDDCDCEKCRRRRANAAFVKGEELPEEMAEKLAERIVKQGIRPEHLA